MIMLPGLLRRRGLLLTALLVPAATLLLGHSPAEAARPVPPPALDEHDPGATSEVAVLAGGCFWGVQGVFQHVDGVVDAVSGYAGGSRDDAHYMTVSTGTTGHAESVRVTFDPQRISYGRILQIFFSVAHDPTELNYQGPDEGSQYRSALFPADARQEQVARAYIAQLDKAHVFPAPIVTRIEIGRTFYPAEDYHQDFLAQHPDNGYIVAYDLPKLRELQTLFPGLYRANPVLVASAAKSTP